MFARLLTVGKLKIGKSSKKVIKSAIINEKEFYRRLNMPNDQIEAKLDLILLKLDGLTDRVDRLEKTVTSIQQMQMWRIELASFSYVFILITSQDLFILITGLHSFLMNLVIICYKGESLRANLAFITLPVMVKQNERYRPSGKPFCWP